MNQARLRVLKEREDHVHALLDEATKRLGMVTKDQNKYAKLLDGLIMQGLFQLLEKNVTIRCRKEDEDLVQRILPKCIATYKDATKKDTNVTMAKDYLGPDISGGVEILAHGGKIKVVNTLESRLELISQQMLPEIREALFGHNPNRKFAD